LSFSIRILLSFTARIAVDRVTQSAADVERRLSGARWSTAALGG
jgi:hypothetical protein